MKADILSGVDERIIVLHLNYDDIMKRIAKRCRTGEEFYHPLMIKSYCRHYELLYEKFKHDYYINDFDDFDKVIDKNIVIDEDIIIDHDVDYNDDEL